jgi:endoglucanase
MFFPRRFRQLGRLLTLAALVLCAPVACEKKPAPSTRAAVPAVPSAVPKSRLERLKLGVNLSHWYWLHPADADPANRDDFISAAELSALAKAGATHVRLPIQPSDLWDTASNSLRPGAEGPIQRAIEKILASGLAVILDAHPTQQEWKSIPPGSTQMLQLERFWDALGLALASSFLDPERVFIEMLNEPQGIKDAGDWAKAQESLLKVVRRHFPNHTIIATGDQWGSIDGLLRSTPLPDGNVIYSFHTYDPTVFTHQGATWGHEPWKHMRDVPYPLDKETVKPAIAATQDQSVINSLKWDTRTPWNTVTIRANIKQAADWASVRGVPLYCGEFGVYAKFAKHEHRIAWLRDVSAALDEFKIGRAMWDYCGSFGVAAGTPGERTIDEEVAKAIGLTP